MPTSVGLTKPSAGMEMEIGISTVSRPREARLSSSEQEVMTATAKTIIMVKNMFFKSVSIINIYIITKPRDISSPLSLGEGSGVRLFFSSLGEGLGVRL